MRTGSPARRVALACSAALALATSCGDALDAVPARCVVLVTCDALRADHVGFAADGGLAGHPGWHGGSVSPALDAFARDAVVFDDAWSCAPMTLPAFSSLFTGLTPDELGVGLGNRWLLAPEVVTLAEELAQAGVETAAVVSNAVLRRAPASLGAVGVAQGFAHYDDRLRQDGLARPAFERPAPETVAAALEWLDGRADPRRPFFLWVHFIEPHGPYTAGWDPAAAPEGGSGRELPLGATDSGLGQIPRYQAIGELRDPAHYRRRYEAEVRYVDAAIGELLAALRERGLYDAATIVFSSDHGESLGEHDYWFSHGETVYRDQVQVPLVVRSPLRAAQRGTRRSDTVSHLALRDTVLAALGVSPHGPTLFDDPGAPALAVHSLGAPGTPRHRLGVSDGRHHLILHGDGRHELYDVRDPREERDLAAREPARLEALRVRCQALLGGRDADVPPAVRMRELRERQRRELRALGYGGGEEH